MRRGFVARLRTLRYLAHQSWSTQDGLPQGSVHAIAQTPDGYLWLATEAGLARFDGFTFRVFDHTSTPAFLSEDLCCLATDSGGGLLIGTADGLILFRDGRFRRLGPQEGWALGGVSSLVRTANNSISITTASGVAAWTGGQIRQAPSEERSTLSVPHEEAAWSFDTQSVLLQQNGRQRKWNVGSELPRGRIQKLYVDSQGLAWVGTDAGLYIIDAGSGKVQNVAALGANSVLSIFQDSEGDHWIGTETSGLHLLRRLTFRGEPGLVSEAITSVAQTIEGSLWVGTREHGVRQVRDGLVTQPVPPSALTSPVILCIAPDPKGGLWVGTPVGLNHIDSTNHVRRITSADGLPDDYVRTLAGDVDGSVWVGTQHGLAHVDGRTVKTLTASDGLAGDAVGSLLLAGGREKQLWAGTSGGLSAVSSTSKITNYTPSSGQGSRVVTAMALDGQGRLWTVSSPKQLSFFNGDRFISVDAELATEIDGMRFDAGGALWLRGKRGILRLPSLALRACTLDSQCARPTAVTYGAADGILNAEVVSGGLAAPWLAQNGELWFATRDGVAVVNTAEAHAPQHAVPVALQRVLLDDQPIGLPTPEVNIQYGHGRLTIEYVGLSFSAPAAVRYRFQMVGFDKTWVEGGSRRFASYTNLPPGHYVFRVQAAGADGTWNEQAASLKVRVVPPFYRTWWFLLLLLLLLLAAIAGAYLIRLRVLKKRFDAVLAERNRMAREIHDTLTQDFVGTSVQLDIIAQHLTRGKTEQAMEQVKRTRQLVTDGLAEARQSIWELRANESQDTLPVRLGRLVQRDTLAKFETMVTLGGAYRPLDPRVEREVLRVAQEALSNTVRHAQATQVCIDLHYASDTLMLSVQDDGQGFAMDAVAETGHYGLLGMRERAASIDGTVEMISKPGEGTRITLRVPAPPGERKR